MYLINMPLFVINELHLNKELAGTLMGTAAGLEIPVMIFAGYLTKYFSKKRLMMIALVSGLAFYSSLLFAEQTWQLIGLQMLNAIFIGITATIGMVYFQDLMPTKMGTATTLFSNAAKSSWIIGGPVRALLRKSGITTLFLCRCGTNFYQCNLYVESQISLIKIKKSGQF